MKVGDEVSILPHNDNRAKQARGIYRGAVVDHKGRFLVALLRRLPTPPPPPPGAKLYVIQRLDGPGSFRDAELHISKDRIVGLTKSSHTSGSEVEAGGGTFEKGGTGDGAVSSPDSPQPEPPQKRKSRCELRCCFVGCNTQFFLNYGVLRTHMKNSHPDVEFGDEPTEPAFKCPFCSAAVAGGVDDRQFSLLAHLAEKHGIAQSPSDSAASSNAAQASKVAEWAARGGPPLRRQFVAAIIKAAKTPAEKADLAVAGVRATNFRFDRRRAVRSLNIPPLPPPPPPQTPQPLPTSPRSFSVRSNSVAYSPPPAAVGDSRRRRGIRPTAPTRCRPLARPEATPEFFRFSRRLCGRIEGPCAA